MALVRWESAAELNTIQSEVNRLFNSLFDTPTRSFGAETTRRWVPAMDVVESDDHYVLHADLPGLAEQDISIELESGVLRISGERKDERTEENRRGYRRIERSYGSFSRSLKLPDGVDGDAVQASFSNGVLEVKIPKPAQHKPRKVTIAVGSNDTAGASDTASDTAGASDTAATVDSSATA
jgi:HSP20 family protein